MSVCRDPVGTLGGYRLRGIFQSVIVNGPFTDVGVALPGGIICWTPG